MQLFQRPHTTSWVVNSLGLSKLIQCNNIKPRMVTRMPLLHLYSIDLRVGPRRASWLAQVWLLHNLSLECELMPVASLRCEVSITVRGWWVEKTALGEVWVRGSVSEALWPAGSRCGPGLGRLLSFEWQQRLPGNATYAPQRHTLPPAGPHLLMACPVWSHLDWPTDSLSTAVIQMPLCAADCRPSLYTCPFSLHFKFKPARVPLAFYWNTLSSHHTGDCSW